MSKLIIEANLTDEQIAIIAIGLGYKKEIQDGEKVVKGTPIRIENEDGSPILNNNGEEQFMPTQSIEPNIIPNPQTDDEFVREYFTKYITETTGRVFAKVELEKLEAQKRAILDGIESNVNKSIATQKI